MTRFLACAAAAVLAMGFSAARAQYDYGGYRTPYYGGGTVYGSAAHGYADIVRSAGVYNLTTSEAYKNLEDARRKNIDNRLQWTKTYFEMRRINDEYRRAQYERDKLSPEAMIRYAQASAPRRLTSSQLDPITGYVAWPRLLLSTPFNEQRREIDQLYAQRANTKGAIGGDTFYVMLAKIETMQERLRKLIKNAPPDDYIAATKFLESLKYETRFPSG